MSASDPIDPYDADTMDVAGTDALSPTLPQALPGARPSGPALGRYPISGKLGQGGMGEVLSVRDPRIGRLVAAKVMRADGALDEVAAAKFVREAQVTGQLEHPNIVPLYDLDRSDDGQLFFTMKRIEGGELTDLVRGRFKGEDPGEAERHRQLVELLRIFDKVCDAMAFAHHRGIVHRDLKPANVMVGRFGEVLVMDWGLARVEGHSELSGTATGMLGDEGDSSPELSQAGAVLGTPHFMAPEQARGETERIDARSDIYALGAILYVMLTGRPPIDGKTALQVIEAVARGAVIPPSERRPVPWELEAAVLRAMALDPGERYQSVEALQADVQAYVAGRTLQAARYSALERARRALWRLRWPLAAGLACLLALAGGVGWVRWQQRQEQLAHDARKLAVQAALLQRADARMAELLAAIASAPSAALPGLAKASSAGALHEELEQALAAESAAGQPAVRLEPATAERWVADALARVDVARLAASLARREGQLHADGDRQPEAFEACARAYRLGSTTPEGIDGLAFVADGLLRERRFEPALRAITTVLAASEAPQARHRLLDMLGRCLLGLGRPGDALRAFRAAAELGESSEADRRRLALAERLGRPLELGELGTLIAAGDLDGDGRAELIVNDHRDNTSGVWGLAEGGMRKRWALDGGLPSDAVVGRFGADGQPLLATARLDGQRWTVDVLAARNGKLERRHRAGGRYNPNAGRPILLRAADIDRDGVDELYILTAPMFESRQLRRTASGWVARPIAPPSQRANPSDLAVLEAGELIVALGRFSEFSLVSYRLEGDRFSQTRRQRVGRPLSLLPLDADGDGRLELALHCDLTGYDIVPSILGLELELALPFGTHLLRARDGALRPFLHLPEMTVPWLSQDMTWVIGECPWIPLWSKLSGSALLCWSGRPADQPEQLHLGGLGVHAAVDLDGDGRQELIALRGKQLVAYGAGPVAPGALPTHHQQMRGAFPGEEPLSFVADLRALGLDGQARAHLEQLADLDGASTPSRLAGQAALALIDDAIAAGEPERAHQLAERAAARHPLLASRALAARVDLHRRDGQLPELAAALARWRALNPSVPERRARWWLDANRKAGAAKLPTRLRLSEQPARFRASDPLLATRTAEGVVLGSGHGGGQLKYAGAVRLDGGPWTITVRMRVDRWEWSAGFDVGLWPASEPPHRHDFVTKTGNDWTVTLYRVGHPDGLIMTRHPELEVTLRYDPVDQEIRVRWSDRQSGKVLRQALLPAPPQARGMGWHHVGLHLHHEYNRHPMRVLLRELIVETAAGQPAELPAHAAPPVVEAAAARARLLNDPAARAQLLTALLDPATARHPLWPYLEEHAGSIEPDRLSALIGELRKAAGGEPDKLGALANRAMQGKRIVEAWLAIEALVLAGGGGAGLESARLQLLDALQLWQRLERAAQASTASAALLREWSLARAEVGMRRYPAAAGRLAKLLAALPAEVPEGNRAAIRDALTRARWRARMLAGKSPAPSLERYRPDEAVRR